MSWSWSWVKEVMITFLELVLAVSGVIWTFLCSWVPVLLVVDLLGHTFAVLFFLCRSSLLPAYSLSLLSSFLDVTSHDKNVAFALLGVFLFALVMTAGPLLQMWMISWKIHRRGYRPPSAAVFGQKSIMQANTSPGVSARHTAQGFRPNKCTKCAPSPRELEDGRSNMKELDRMYHGMTESGKDLGCLPVFDHYCWWLWVAVSMPTTKSYLIFMPWLIAFHSVSIGILAWPLAIWQWQANAWLYVFVVACFPCMLVLVLAAPIRAQWRRLGCMDSPGKEYTLYMKGRRTPAFPMYVKRSDGTYAHVVMSYNPWDQGTVLNLRSVLGDSVWTWPFWFVAPRRVREYGTGEEDLPLSSRFREDVHGTQTSSAFRFAMADIELQTLDPVRRRRGFSSEE
ncbi:dhhc zinc finger domain-containing protein [Colletotrichum kahawae]|uniref:Dhhc zinc finger domain-containing protein n=1 Tax=Colletotrichum kahawae TaxID=34407 RepID=A0AAD9YTR5_COLKA|nr:dhhc zinc finger domain-containing protein [Colletotrichum kahawae]